MMLSVSGVFGQFKETVIFSSLSSELCRQTALQYGFPINREIYIGKPQTLVKGEYLFKIFSEQNVQGNTNYFFTYCQIIKNTLISETPSEPVVINNYYTTVQAPVTPTPAPIVTQIATYTTFTNPPVLDKSLYTIPANPLLATPTATLTPATVTNTATPFIAGLDKYTFTRNLKLGMKGKDVEVLQKLLGLTPTGYFGLSTRNMVVLYQKKNNLPATGFVGPSTRAVLNR